MSSPTTDAGHDLDAYWRELVTAAMLGTDRREPPPPPAGPLADLVPDAQRPDGASRMLASVAAVAAARRAAFVPGPVADGLAPLIQLPDRPPRFVDCAVGVGLGARIGVCDRDIAEGPAGDLVRRLTVGPFGVP